MQCNASIPDRTTRRDDFKGYYSFHLKVEGRNGWTWPPSTNQQQSTTQFYTNQPEFEMKHGLSFLEMVKRNVYTYIVEDAKGNKAIF